MQIEIKRPLEFILTVLETDEHVPSMRVQAKIVAAQFQHTFHYAGAFWIECSQWDCFVESLRDSTAKAASLTSMSSEFKLLIQKNDAPSSIILELKKANVAGSQTMTFVFEAAIDDDMLARIRDEFFSFPVWWELPK